MKIKKIDNSEAVLHVVSNFSNYFSFSLKTAYILYVQFWCRMMFINPKSIDTAVVDYQVISRYQVDPKLVYEVLKYTPNNLFALGNKSNLNQDALGAGKRFDFLISYFSPQRALPCTPSTTFFSQGPEGPSHAPPPPPFLLKDQKGSLQELEESARQVAYLLVRQIICVKI